MIGAQGKMVMYALVAAILIGIGAAGAWVWQDVRYVNLELRMSQREVEQAAEAKKAVDKIAEYYDQQRFETEKNRAETYAKWRKDHDELTKLRSDVASGKYRVYIPGKCTGQPMPQTAASSSGAPAGACVVDPDTEQDILDLTGSIKHNEGLLRLCRQEYLLCKNYKQE